MKTVLPKISVIVPVYNVAWNLDKCINSILNQTYTNFELLLVNDGSKDNSLEICRKYESQDSRVIVVDKVNTGVSDTRNVGIHHASGEYITFVDSDDWIDSTYLDDFKICDDEMNASLYMQGIVYDIPGRPSVSNVMFEYDNVKLTIPRNIKYIQDHHLLLNGCPYAKLYLTRIIKECGLSFNTTISLNEDHLFVLDYYSHINTIYLSNAVNYHYYFNYKLPSLTKIKHDSTEYLQIARLIHRSFKKLSDLWRIDTDFSETEAYLFGPNQLIKASYSVLIYEKNKYSSFLKILDQWKGMGFDTQQFSVTGFYESVFVENVKSKSREMLFMLLYITACLNLGMLNVKYFLKKYILKY